MKPYKIIYRSVGVIKGTYAPSSQGFYLEQLSKDNEQQAKEKFTYHPKLLAWLQKQSTPISGYYLTWYRNYKNKNCFRILSKIDKPPDWGVPFLKNTSIFYITGKIVDTDNTRKNVRVKVYRNRESSHNGTMPTPSIYQQPFNVDIVSEQCLECKVDNFYSFICEYRKQCMHCIKYSRPVSFL